ncbi:hypothetical protein [Actinosynnema sp. NPDC023587]|uniref:hypothetical protein n=1 Tax=Actinosynnema sp. NPDC023587 TaxID=3154695 RepID=UPI0033DB589D
MDVDLHADLRREVAFRALGAARVLLTVDSLLDDVRGAAGAGQVEVAVDQACVVIAKLAGIAVMRTGGEIDDAGDYLAFDPYSALPPDDAERVTELFSLAVRVLDGTSAPDELTDALTAFATDLTTRMGYERLPELRRAEGLFPALRLAREWLPVVDLLGLPDLLPTAWTREVR